MAQITDPELLKSLNSQRSAIPQGMPPEEKDSSLSEELGVGTDVLSNTFDSAAQVFNEGMLDFEQGAGSWLSNQGTHSQERYKQEEAVNTQSRYNISKNKKKNDEAMSNLDETGQYVAMAPSLAANIAPAFIPVVGPALSAAVGTAMTVGEIAADDISKSKDFDYSEMATAGGADFLQNYLGAKYITKAIGGGKKFDKAGNIIDKGSIGKRIVGEGASGGGTSVGSELIFNWATDKELTDNLGTAAVVGTVLGSSMKTVGEGKNLKNMDWSKHKPLKSMSDKFSGSKFNVSEDVKDKAYKGMVDNASFEQELMDIRDGKSDKNAMDVAEDFYETTKGNKAKAAMEAVTLLDKHGFTGTDAMFGGSMTDGTKIGEIFDVSDDRVQTAQKKIKDAVHGLTSKGGVTSTQHLSDIKKSADLAMKEVRGGVTEQLGKVSLELRSEKLKGSEGSDKRIAALTRLEQELKGLQDSLGKIINPQGTDTPDSTKLKLQASNIGELLVRTDMVDKVRGTDGGIFNPRETVETAFAIDSMAASEHPSYRQSVADPHSGRQSSDWAAAIAESSFTGGLPVFAGLRDANKLKNRRKLGSARKEGKVNQQKIVSDLAGLRTKTMKPTDIESALDKSSTLAAQELAADGFDVNAPDAVNTADITREQRVSGLRDLGYDNDAEVESILDRMDKLDKMQQDEISADPVKAKEDIVARRDKLKDMGYTDSQIDTLEPTLRGEKLPTIDPKTVKADKEVSDAQDALNVNERSLNVAQSEAEYAKGTDGEDAAKENVAQAKEDVKKGEDAVKFAKDSRSKIDEPKTEGEKAVDDVEELRSESKKPKKAPKEEAKKSTPLPVKDVKKPEGRVDVVPATNASINLVPKNLQGDVADIVEGFSTGLQKSFPNWDKTRIDNEATEAIATLMGSGGDYRKINASDVKSIVEGKHAQEIRNNTAASKPLAKDIVSGKRSSEDIVDSMKEDANTVGIDEKFVNQYMIENGIAPSSVKESQYASIMKGAATNARLDKEYKQTPNRIKKSVKGHTPDQLERAYTEKGFDLGDDVSIKDARGITKELAKIVRTDAEKKQSKIESDAKSLETKAESTRKELKADQNRADSKALAADKAETRATEKALKERDNKQAQSDKAQATKDSNEAKEAKKLADKELKDFEDELSANKKDAEGLVKKSEKLDSDIKSLEKKSTAQQDLINKELQGIEDIRINNPNVSKSEFNKLPQVQSHNRNIDLYESRQAAIEEGITDKNSELNSVLSDSKEAKSVVDDLRNAREAEANIAQAEKEASILDELIDEHGMSERKELIESTIDHTQPLDAKINKLNKTVARLKAASKKSKAKVKDAVKIKADNEALKLNADEVLRLSNALMDEWTAARLAGDLDGASNAKAAMDSVGHARPDVRTPAITETFNRWKEYGIDQKIKYPDNPELWIPTDAKREMSDILKGSESSSGVGDWHQNLRSDIYGNIDSRPKYSKDVIEGDLMPLADKGGLSSDPTFTNPKHPGLNKPKNGDRKTIDGEDYMFNGKHWVPDDGNTPPPDGPGTPPKSSSSKSDAKPKGEDKKPQQEPKKAPEPKPKKDESAQDFYNRANKLPEEDVYAMKADEEMYGALSPANKTYLDKLISEYDAQADAEKGMTQAQKGFDDNGGKDVNEKMADIISGGDVKKAFEKLDKAGVANKGTKTLVKRLSQILPKNIRLFMTEMDDAFGAYNVADNPKDRYIRLTDDTHRRSHGQDIDSMERTFIHEGVHAATSHIIKDVKNNSGNYSKGQKQAVEKLNNLYKDTKAHIEANGDQDKFPKFHAMFADVDEFVTYSMMDPDVQKELNKIQLHNYPDKSVMSQFLEDIAQILGMPLNQKSVLAEVVNIGDDMIKLTGGDRGALSKYDTSVKDTNAEFLKMKPKKKAAFNTLSEVDKVVASEKEKVNSLSDELDYIEARMKHEEDRYDRDSSTAVDRDDANKELKGLNNDLVRIESEHIQAVKEYEDAYRKAAQDITKAKVNPVKAKPSPVVTKASPKRGKKLTGQEKALREMSLKDIDDLLSSPTGKKLPADKIKTFTDEIDRRLNPEPVAPAKKKKTTTSERDGILTLDNNDTSDGTFDPLAELDKIAKQGKKSKPIPSKVIQTPAEQIAFRKGITEKIDGNEQLTEAEFDFVKDKGGKAFDSLEDMNIPRSRKGKGPVKGVAKKGNKAPTKRVAALSDIPDSGPITGKDVNVTGVLGEIRDEVKTRKKKGEREEDELLGETDAQLEARLKKAKVEALARRKKLAGK